MSSLNLIRWPDGVADILGIASVTLNARRADGDCPKLYAPTPRVLVTTEADLLDWIRSKAVEDGYKCRPGNRKRNHA